MKEKEVAEQMKKKMMCLALCVVMMMGTLAGCGKGKEAAAEKTLNVFAFEGAIPQSVYDSFSEKFGAKINYSFYEYGEEMLAKLEEADGGDYDVIIADDYIMGMVNEEGLAAELDKSKIPNYDNQDPAFMSLFYDPENKYDVVYGVGIPLIVYDPSLTNVKFEGYDDLWDASLKDNVALIGNYRVIEGITMKTFGESLNCEDLDVIAKAGDKLKDLAPNIRAITDTDTQDLLISGEVAAAFLYTSQVTKALKANPDLKTAFPKEGLGIGTMGQFIPKNAPNPDLAYEFINYILEPEISAECFDSEDFGYYCTNTKAPEFISEENRAYVTIPEGLNWESGEAIQLIGDEANDLEMSVWEEFLSACG